MNWKYMVKELLRNNTDELDKAGKTLGIVMMLAFILLAMLMIAVALTGP